MRKVNIYEAKTSLSALLQAVAAGDEIVITKRNKPIARLLPFTGTKAQPTFGMARKTLEQTGITRDDIARAIEPLTEGELAAWDIA